MEPIKSTDGQEIPHIRTTFSRDLPPEKLIRLKEELEKQGTTVYVLRAGEILSDKPIALNVDTLDLSPPAPADALDVRGALLTILKGTAAEKLVLRTRLEAMETVDALPLRQR